MSLIRKQQLKNSQKYPEELEQICAKIFQDTGINITFSKLLQHRYENNQLQQNLKKTLEDFQNLLRKMKVEYVIFSPENIQFCIEENQQLKNYYQKYNQQNSMLWEKVAVKIDSHKISYSNKVSLQRHLIINYHYGKRFYQLLQNEGKRLSVKFKLATDHSYKNKLTFLDIQKVLTVLKSYQPADIPKEIRRITLTYNSSHHSDSFKLIQIPISGSVQQIKQHFDQIIEDLKTIKSFKISMPELCSNHSSISKQKDNLFKEIQLKDYIKDNNLSIKYSLITSNKKEVVFSQDSCSFDLQQFSLNELKSLLDIANREPTRSIFSVSPDNHLRLFFTDLGQSATSRITYTIQAINSVFTNQNIEELPFDLIEISQKQVKIQAIIKLLDDKNTPLPRTINLNFMDDQNQIQMMILTFLKIAKKRKGFNIFKNWQKFKIKSKNNNRQKIKEVFFSPVEIN